MKKVLMLIMAFAVLMSFAACGGSEKGAEPESGKANVKSEDTENDENVGDFEEIVLLDDDVCLFKITGVDEDSIFGYTVKAYFENRSEKDLMISLDDTSVNGYMCDPYFAVEIAAGAKSNEEITFMASDFEEIGITDVTYIEFTLSASDTDSYDTVFEKLCLFCPMGEERMKDDVRESQDTDVVLMDNENCTVTVIGFKTDELLGYTMDLYIENKSDISLDFSADNVTVNGFMVDPYWAETVSAGKMSVSSVSWFETDFEDNGITEVEEIVLTLNVSETDEWFLDPIASETYTVNP